MTAVTTSNRAVTQSSPTHVQQTQQTQRLGGEPRAAEALKARGLDGYEVSDPRRRLPIDRAGQVSPAGDPTLASQVSVLRSIPPQGRSGRTEGHGNGLNNGADSLRSGTGRISARDWEQPERVVGHLTQTPGAGEAGNSAYRCGPSNLLAASLMDGPASGARFLNRVADGAGSAQLTDGQRDELRGIAGRLNDRTATYEDLSRAQGLLYRAGNTEDTAFGLANTLAGSSRLSAAERRQASSVVTALNTPGSVMSASQRRTLERLGTKHYGQPTRLEVMNDQQRPTDASAQYWGVRVGGRAASENRSGFNDREIANLASLGGAGGSTSGASLNYGVAHPVEDLVSRLEPGQSATVRVHHEALTPENEDTATPDHFITVGRRADGTAYLYNSDPSQGDHTLFVGRPGERQPQNFTDELRRYDNRLTYDGDRDQPLTVGASW